MIKTITSLVVAMLAATAAFADDIPAAPRGRPVEYEATQALFGRVGTFEPEAQTVERFQFAAAQPQRELTLGAYDRVDRHLKLGVFYRLQYGARHDNDWVNDSLGRWVWRDTAERPESVLVVDATPRAALDFLPGGNWVASTKVRAEHNLFNGQNSLLVSPELSWFWMDGLSPLATVALRQETWFPLNWGETAVYSSWWYLSALWHARDWLSLGPLVALREETWSTSADFRSQNPGADYKVVYRSWVLGANLVARW